MTTQIIQGKVEEVRDKLTSTNKTMVMLKVSGTTISFWPNQLIPRPQVGEDVTVQYEENGQFRNGKTCVKGIVGTPTPNVQPDEPVRANVSFDTSRTQDIHRQVFLKCAVDLVRSGKVSPADGKTIAQMTIEVAKDLEEFSKGWL